MAHRYITWDLLKILGSVSNLPWLCVEDFNELLSQDEKLEGGLRLGGKWIFSEMLLECVVFWRSCIHAQDLHGSVELVTMLYLRGLIWDLKLVLGLICFPLRLRIIFFSTV